MKAMDEESSEYVSISIAGIDEVQNVMGREEKRSFFQDMMFDRPELAEKLTFWFDYIYEKKGEIPNVRKVTFDLLEYILDKFVESDSSEQSKIGEEDGS